MLSNYVTNLLKKGSGYSIFETILFSEFKLDDKAKKLISNAKMKYLETVNSLDVRLMDFRVFGRSLCKPNNISPDALMQLSFQVTRLSCTIQTFFIRAILVLYTLNSVTSLNSVVILRHSYSSYKQTQNWCITLKYHSLNKLKYNKTRYGS